MDLSYNLSVKRASKDLRHNTTQLVFSRKIAWLLVFFEYVVMSSSENLYRFFILLWQVTSRDTFVKLEPKYGRLLYDHIVIVNFNYSG